MLVDSSRTSSNWTSPTVPLLEEIDKRDASIREIKVQILPIVNLQYMANHLVGREATLSARTTGPGKFSMFEGHMHTAALVSQCEALVAEREILKLMFADAYFFTAFSRAVMQRIYWSSI